MSRKIKERPILQNIKIEAVAAEGKSLAHIDGKVLFVSQVVPGDVIDVQLTKSRKGYMEGYAVRIVTPSPFRQKPLCEHFGECGGCKWQILPYQMQIDFKQQQVVDQLTRIGHLNLPVISPIIGSEKTEYYRNKLEYTFSNRRWVLKGEDPESIKENDWCGLGFHIAGFFDKVLDIKDCKLQKDPSNSIRLFIKEYAVNNNLDFFNLRDQTGFLRTIIIRTSTTDEVMLTVVFGPDADEKMLLKEGLIDNCRAEEILERRNSLMEAIKVRFPAITSLLYILNSKKNDTINDLECVLYSGRECIYEKMDNLRFKIGPKSFYQTNSEQAHRLYSLVKNFAFDDDQIKGGRKPVIYDLYTGTGTIALFLSSNAEKVVGIEYIPEAIEDAKVNAAENGIENAEIGRASCRERV